MGANSKIEWTHHTFNPWRGCTKVSAGCANCYAAVDRSVKLHGITWGPNGDRAVKAESGWGEPLKWDRDAATAGERHRVFCASLADVFEGPDTMPGDAWSEVRNARLRLFQLILRTPHLDWLLLTKRPQNVMPLIEQSAMYSRPGDVCEMLNGWLKGGAPENVWLGASIENQETADERSAHLRRCPAVVRFYSAEPVLAAIPRLPLKGISWVIVGGESGPNARPMHPAWATDLRDQCQAARVSFHFKQWGEYRTTTLEEAEAEDQRIVTLVETPDHDECDRWPMTRVGKAAAGRLLDGRTWDEFPVVRN